MSLKGSLWNRIRLGYSRPPIFARRSYSLPQYFSTLWGIYRSAASGHTYLSDQTMISSLDLLHNRQVLYQLADYVTSTHSNKKGAQKNKFHIKQVSFKIESCTCHSGRVMLHATLKGKCTKYMLLKKDMSSHGKCDNAINEKYQKNQNHRRGAAMPLPFIQNTSHYHQLHILVQSMGVSGCIDQWD